MVDTSARVGFEENDIEVVIYAQYYTNHDGRAILDYLKNKVEEPSEPILDYSQMTKKELLEEIEKKGLDSAPLSRKKNSELVELLNEN